MGIGEVVSQLTLTQLSQVRYLHPQPGSPFVMDDPFRAYVEFIAGFAFFSFRNSRFSKSKLFQRSPYGNLQDWKRWRLRQHHKVQNRWDLICKIWFEERRRCYFPSFARTSGVLSRTWNPMFMYMITRLGIIKIIEIALFE